MNIQTNAFVHPVALNDSGPERQLIEEATHGKSSAAKLEGKHATYLKIKIFIANDGQPNQMAQITR